MHQCHILVLLFKFRVWPSRPFFSRRISGLFAYGYPSGASWPDADLSSASGLPDLFTPHANRPPKKHSPGIKMSEAVWIREGRSCPAPSIQALILLPGPCFPAARRPLCLHFFLLYPRPHQIPQCSRNTHRRISAAHNTDHQWKCKLLNRSHSQHKEYRHHDKRRQ